MSLWDSAREHFYRIAASGLIPARLFAPAPPRSDSLPARTGRLEIEIVSHCWRYAHMQAYQLESLVAFPPADASVRMTVFYSREDRDTVRLLERFGAMSVPGVTWNWQAIPSPQLFRRSIGRNMAALSTRADWIWFTDCDVIFGEGCIDSLAGALQGRRDALVFPAEERITSLLGDDDPILSRSDRGLVDVDLGRFVPVPIDRAKGSWQITHGNVARVMGYCAQIPFYQEPRERWNKAYEDRAFRWLLRTSGHPVEAKAFYRIRHAAKGRYDGRRPLTAALRGRIRRAVSRVQELLR